jgi:DNA-binding XRE family transcriptional regulator
MTNPQKIVWPAVGKGGKRTTRQYLAATKKKLGIKSDYALAKHLGVTKASMSLLTNGHSVMSNTTAAKVAEILELDLREVIADCELERGTADELWERIRNKVVAIVPALAVAAIGAAVLYSLVMDARGAFDIAASWLTLGANAEALAFGLLMPEIRIVALAGVGVLTLLAAIVLGGCRPPRCARAQAPA